MGRTREEERKGEERRGKERNGESSTYVVRVVRVGEQTCSAVVVAVVVGWRYTSCAAIVSIYPPRRPPYVAHVVARVVFVEARVRRLRD